MTCVIGGAKNIYHFENRKLATNAVSDTTYHYADPNSKIVTSHPKEPIESTPDAADAKKNPNDNVCNAKIPQSS